MIFDGSGGGGLVSGLITFTLFILSPNDDANGNGGIGDVFGRPGTARSAISSADVGGTKLGSILTFPLLAKVAPCVFALLVNK